MCSGRLSAPDPLSISITRRIPPIGDGWTSVTVVWRGDLTPGKFTSPGRVLRNIAPVFWASRLRGNAPLNYGGEPRILRPGFVQHFLRAVNSVKPLLLFID